MFFVNEYINTILLFLNIGYNRFCALVLLITKGDHRCKHCPNFASFELFLNQNTGLHLFTSKANQNSV